MAHNQALANRQAGEVNHNAQQARVRAAVLSVIGRYATQLGQQAYNELETRMVRAAQQGGTALANAIHDLGQWGAQQGSWAASSAIANIQARLTAAAQGNGALANIQEDDGITIWADDPWNDGELTNQDETTLDELIPESMDSSASGPTEPPAEARAAASSGGPGGGVSKETPISNYPSLSYGVQETHTTILPWTGWLSAAKMDTGAPLQLKIRMNAPYDMLSGLTMGDAGTTLAKNFYNVPMSEGGTYANVATIAFPEVIANGTTTTTERPAWREYWAQLYSYYTVLGCEYKITVYNPVSNIGANVMVGTQFDSYSDATGSTGNVMPLANLSEVMAFKNIKWDIVSYSRSEVPNKNVSVISGTYKPGQIKRNIINDGDVKTWTATGAIPNLKEILTVNLWRAPLAWHLGNAVNMQIELKYIVQFKDLKLQARYPNTVTSDQDITQILSEDPGATGAALQEW